jgi:hypothetical protein
VANTAEKLPSVATNQNPKRPGWTDDELSAFIEATHQNQYATFFTTRGAMSKLVVIDSHLRRSQRAGSTHRARFGRCCSSGVTVLSGQRPVLAMSGQAAEMYVQCRAMLEYAAYAVRTGTLRPQWSG